jgi:RNA polymerase sporulation-specific sigma factor
MVTHERIIETAHFVLDTGATVRQAAKHFCLSKSTVHMDLTQRLRREHPELHGQVAEILAAHMRERHLRGGAATKAKFAAQREWSPKGDLGEMSHCDISNPPTLMTDEQEKLVTENLRLAGYFAKKYARSGLEFDDLYSIACVGLCKAALHYDPARSKFSTYASRCMANEINMALRRRKERWQGVTLVSLDAEVAEGLTHRDLIADDAALPGETAEQNERAAQVLAGVERLSAKSRRALVLRYGLCGETAHSQSEAAAAMGFSQSYVSRLVQTAQKQLRKNMEEPA